MEPHGGASLRERVDAVYEAAEELGEDAVLRRIDEILDDYPADDPERLLEAAGARDFAGLEAEAEPLYRAALAGGLTGAQRAEAVIQLASTVRNLGRAGEAVALHEAELEAGLPEEYRAAAAAFLALALASDGRGAEGVAVAVEALVPTLPYYRRALGAYAAELRGGA